MSKAVFRYESELVAVVEAVLGATGNRLAREVPCLGRSVDLLVVKGNALVAIECKLNDWRRGLKQAEHHLLAVDYSYVCVPNRRVTETMQEAFAQSQVGLYLCDPKEDKLIEICQARQSMIKWATAEDWVRSAVEEEGYDA